MPAASTTETEIVRELADPSRRAAFGPLDEDLLADGFRQAAAMPGDPLF